MSQGKLNLNEKFNFGKVLGKGTFATVVLTQDNTSGEEYAMKVIEKAKCKGQEEHIIKEITIMKQVKHKNIIKLFDVYETRDKLYLQMEYCNGGELFDRIVNVGFYSEEDAKVTVRCLVEALDYLHKQNIVHRDLKPENLLLGTDEPDADIKIADFGLSTIVEPNDMLKTNCGTLTYVAPEVLTGRGYGKPVDMWAVGVITYILLSGYPPFFGDSDADILDLTIRGSFKYFSPEWDLISNEAKSFISALIVVDPAKRMTAEQALAHPWIKSRVAPKDRVDISSHVTPNLVKNFNARKKLRSGVEAVMAMQKLNALGKSKSKDHLL